MYRIASSCEIRKVPTTLASQACHRMHFRTGRVQHRRVATAGDDAVDSSAATSDMRSSRVTKVKLASARISGDFSECSSGEHLPGNLPQDAPREAKDEVHIVFEEESADVLAVRQGRRTVRRSRPAARRLRVVEQQDARAGGDGQRDPKQALFAIGFDRLTAPGQLMITI